MSFGIRVIQWDTSYTERLVAAGAFDLMKEWVTWSSSLEYPSTVSAALEMDPVPGLRKLAHRPLFVGRPEDITALARVALGTAMEIDELEELLLERGPARDPGPISNEEYYAFWDTSDTDIHLNCFLIELRWACDLARAKPNGVVVVA